MASKRVLLLESKEGPWEVFLRDYFSDVPGAFEVVHEPSQAAASFDKTLPAVLFLSTSFCVKTLLSKIKVRKHIDPSFRVYYLGDRPPEEAAPLFDGAFSGEPVLAVFGKRFVETLPMPETARLLVVDDEKEIGAMVSDYFEGRKDPRFEVLHVSDGQEALAAIDRQRPEVIILDIKMPGMDGREFYARLQKRQRGIPTIVFFDSISSEDLAEIRKCGNPAVVEKGYQGSSLAALLQLVKKLIYFGA